MASIWDPDLNTYYDFTPSDLAAAGGDQEKLLRKLRERQAMIHSEPAEFPEAPRPLDQIPAQISAAEPESSFWGDVWKGIEQSASYRLGKAGLLKAGETLDQPIPGLGRATEELSRMPDFALPGQPNLPGIVKGAADIVGMGKRAIPAAIDEYDEDHIKDAILRDESLTDDERTMALYGHEEPSTMDRIGRSLLAGALTTQRPDVQEEVFEERPENAQMLGEVPTIVDAAAIGMIPFSGGASASPWMLRANKLARAVDTVDALMGVKDIAEGQPVQGGIRVLGGGAGAVFGRMDEIPRWTDDVEDVAPPGKFDDLFGPDDGAIKQIDEADQGLEVYEASLISAIDEAEKLGDIDAAQKLQAELRDLQFDKPGDPVQPMNISGRDLEGHLANEPLAAEAAQIQLRNFEAGRMSESQFPDSDRIRLAEIREEMRANQERFANPEVEDPAQPQVVSSKFTKVSKLDDETQHFLSQQPVRTIEEADEAYDAINPGGRGAERGELLTEGQAWDLYKAGRAPEPHLIRGKLAPSQLQKDAADLLKDKIDQGRIKVDYDPANPRAGALMNPEPVPDRIVDVDLNGKVRQAQIKLDGDQGLVYFHKNTPNTSFFRGLRSKRYTEDFFAAILNKPAYQKLGKALGRMLDNIANQAGRVGINLGEIEPALHRFAGFTNDSNAVGFNRSTSDLSFRFGMRDAAGNMHAAQNGTYTNPWLAMDLHLEALRDGHFSEEMAPYYWWRQMRELMLHEVSHTPPGSIHYYNDPAKEAEMFLAHAEETRQAFEHTFDEVEDFFFRTTEGRKQLHEMYNEIRWDTERLIKGNNLATGGASKAQINAAMQHYAKKEITPKPRPLRPGETDMKGPQRDPITGEPVAEGGPKTPDGKPTPEPPEMPEVLSFKEWVAKNYPNGYGKKTKGKIIKEYEAYRKTITTGEPPTPKVPEGGEPPKPPKKGDGEAGDGGGKKPKKEEEPKIKTEIGRTRQFFGRALANIERAMPEAGAKLRRFVNTWENWSSKDIFDSKQLKKKARALPDPEGAEDRIIRYLDGETVAWASIDELKIALEYRKMLRRTAELAETFGVLPGGRRTSYFPHYFKKDWEAPGVVKGTSRRAQDQQAFQDLHLERAREKNRKDWIRNLDILENYFDDAYRRISESMHLGKDHEKLLEDIAKYELGKSDAKYTKQAIEAITQKHGSDPLWSKVRYNLALLDLPLAVLYQPAQATATAGVGGVVRSAMEAAKLFSPSYRKMMGEAAERSGALRPDIMLDTISNTKDFHGKFMWGIPTVDKAMRVHAFAVGHSLKNAAEKGDKAARQALDFLGFEGIDAKAIPADDVGVRLSNKTQFRTGPAQKPVWASNSEVGKFVYQYKHFAWQWGILMKDLFKEGVQKGNWGPLLKTVTIGGLVSGEIVADLRALIKGNDPFMDRDLPYDPDEPEVWLHAILDRSRRVPASHPLPRMLQNFFMIGGLGYFAEFMMEPLLRPDTLKLTGTFIPAARRPGELAEGIGRSVQSGEIEPLAKSVVQQVPIWGYQLGAEMGGSKSRRRRGSRRRGRRGRRR